MDKDMPGFMTYREAALIFALIDDTQAAAAIKATCNYYLTGELPELSGMAARVFEIEMSSINRGRKGWREQVEGGKSRHKKTDSTDS